MNKDKIPIPFVDSVKQILIEYKNPEEVAKWFWKEIQCVKKEEREDVIKIIKSNIYNTYPQICDVIIKEIKESF